MADDDGLRVTILHAVMAARLEASLARDAALALDTIRAADYAARAFDTLTAILPAVDGVPLLRTTTDDSVPPPDFDAIGR